MQTETTLSQHVASGLDLLRQQLQATFSGDPLAAREPLSFVSLRAEVPAVAAQGDSTIDPSSATTSAFQQSIGFFVADRESDCHSEEFEFESDHDEGWF